MKSICLFFQVHNPFKLRTYRFFDIGNSHYYYDDYQNKHMARKLARECYLPANEILLSLIKQHGKDFKVSFSISGLALEQFREFTPEVLESFKKLVKTGNVELLSEPYSHSLDSIKNEGEFRNQVRLHENAMMDLFEQKTTTFCNTSLIYNNYIGKLVSGLGYETLLTEGAKQVLAWKSPNMLYQSAQNPELKLLLRNYQLSDDLTFRFSRRDWSAWPLTAEKYTEWIDLIDKKQEIINLFVDYKTFGFHQKADSGILNFLHALPSSLIKSGCTFKTPSELAAQHNPVAMLDVPYLISWADEERDMTAWQGNELQEDAFESLYSLAHIMQQCDDPDLNRDWNYLQANDHFFYMSTKWFSDGNVHMFENPYDSPYDAYINYMNVLADFSIRAKNYAQAYGIQPSPITENGVQKPKTVKLSAKPAEKISPSKTEKTPKTARKPAKEKLTV